MPYCNTHADRWFRGRYSLDRRFAQTPNRLERPFASNVRMVSSNASLSGTRQMTQAAKAQEPSMEEILASIRRIIADDDAAKSPPPPPEPARAPPVSAAPLRPAPAPAPLPEPAFVPVPAAEPSINETVLDEMLAELNATPPPAEDAAEEMASDVLDLTEEMATPDLAASGFHTI